MTPLGLRLLRRRGERGSAMLTTLLMVGVVTGLATTMAAITIDNTQNAGRDRQAGGALQAAEGGIAQAIQYLRQARQSDLVPGSAACTANAWCNSAAPKRILLDGNTAGSPHYIDVWVERTQAYNPPTTKAAVFTIHATGKFGPGPGTRKIDVIAEGRPFKFPLAVYASQVNAAGTGDIHYESVISPGCIDNRSKIDFFGMDVAYGIPAAAHSANTITDSNEGGAASCTNSSKRIHKAPFPAGYCNTSYPQSSGDQDQDGGPLTGTACLNSSIPADFGATSKINSVSDLARLFDYDAAGISASDINALRTASQAQGFYFTNTTAIPAVLQTGTAKTTYPNPIVFYELAGGLVGSTVNLSDFGNAYARSVPLLASSASCTAYGVIVVVLNGNVKLNSNATMVASIFALGPTPYGNVSKANGTAALIGTLYAKGTLDMAGTIDVWLDDCYKQNLPSTLFNFEVRGFRELDR